jgi:hypothetical protein
MDSHKYDDDDEETFCHNFVTLESISTAARASFLSYETSVDPNSNAFSD